MLECAIFLIFEKNMFYLTLTVDYRVYLIAEQRIIHCALHKHILLIATGSKIYITKLSLS